MENRKSNILLTVIGVATLLVALVGASFAYFSATSSEISQKVKTGALKISVATTEINQAPIKPVKTSEIDTMTKKLAHADVVKLPIEVNTTGTTIESEYTMYLTTSGINAVDAVAEDLGGSKEDIKWELVRDGETNPILTGDFKAGDATKTALHAGRLAVPSQGEGENKTYGGVENYTLLIYIEDSANVQDRLQGLNITAFVTVEAFQTPNN